MTGRVAPAAVFFVLGVFDEANRGLRGVGEFAIFLFRAGRKHCVTLAKRDRREAVRVHLAVVVEPEPGLF